MGTIDNLIATDLAAAISDWGESITYKPKGGTVRTVSVNIKRYMPDAIPGTSRGFSAHVDMEVIRDATTGADTLTRGGDVFTFKDRVDGDATTHSTFEIIGQDAGMWFLRFPTNG